MIAKENISFYTLHSFLYKGVLFLFYLFSFTTVFAQATLPFTNYNINNGLPSSEVYHVMQDSKGFMWFSTDHGVCRYDGYQFKTFTTTDGLADNTIFECKEDYKGRIWFLSFSGKLSYYYHDSIFSLQDNEKLANKIDGQPISSVVIDSSDNLYIGVQCASNIIRIDLKHKNRLKLFPLPKDIIYLTNIAGINMTISGGSPKSNYGDSSFTFCYYNIASKGSILEKKFEVPFKKTIQDIHTGAIKLSDSEICLCACHNFSIIRNGKVIYTHYFNSNILRLDHGPDGEIWIIMQDGLPLCCNHYAITQLPLLNALKGEQITSATIDKEGGLWLTSLVNGVYYSSSSQFMIQTKENGLPGNKINYMTISPDSSLWISASPGNIITVIKKDTLINHPINNSSNPSVINCILFHKDSTVWVNTGLGLYIYNRPDFLHLLPVQYNNPLQDMVQNNDGTVWLNCITNVDIFKIKNNSIFYSIKIPFGRKIKKIINEHDTILWMGTPTGLYQYVNNNIINWGNKYPVLKKRIDDLKLSPSGDLWIATRDTGLILINKKHFSYFNIKNGLINNFSHCLNFDYKGNLWVGTNSGISHLFMHYDKQGNCTLDSIRNIVSPCLREVNCIVSIKNMVYAGTNNGLVSFDMNKMNVNKTPPPVCITGLKINNKNYPINTQNIDLTYDENNVVINYVGLTYRDPSNTVYRYRMKGLDTAWIYTKYINVQYAKLPPGSYSFTVSARNSDGVWSKNYATVYFIIRPPFWGIWWVKTLFVLILSGLIYWRIRLIIKRKLMKVEAAQKLTEMQLRELREQMDPHFLFNNLNTLSYLVESQSPNAPVFVHELSKYFRYSLQSRNMEFTELKNELRQAERYIHLLKIRYGDNLIVHWDIDTSIKEYFISNHSLQLLLENITKHNILSRQNPLLVDIKTTTHNTLIVKNNLQPKTGSEESTGLGLKSIDERYYLLFKKNIIISRTADSFYVELPLLTPYEHQSISS